MSTKWPWNISRWASTQKFSYRIWQMMHQENCIASKQLKSKTRRLLLWSEDSALPRFKLLPPCLDYRNTEQSVLESWIIRVLLVLFGFFLKKLLFCLFICCAALAVSLALIKGTWLNISIGFSPLTYWNKHKKLQSITQHDGTWRRLQCVVLGI